MTTRLTPKQVGGSTKGRGPTCRQHRHRRQSGTKNPLEDDQLEFSAFFKPWRVVIVLRVRDRFRLFGEHTSSQPTGGVNSAPTNTTRTELHSMITFHHANTRGSRAGRLRTAHLLCPWNTCHPRVMSHSLPLTHLIYFSFLSDSLTNTHKIYGPRPTFTLRCSTAEWRINTNPISQRLWAQIGWDQSHRHRSDRAQKNWAWQESWDRSVSNAGKNYEKYLPKSYHWRCGWIWKSGCRDVLPPVTDAFRLWLSEKHCRLGSWKWEKYEKCWLHHFTDKIGRIARHLEYQLHRRNLPQWYRREKQVQSALKLITREEKVWRQVHLRNREQRANLLQCFRQEMRNREINSRVLFPKAQNIKLDLSIIVSASFSNKLMLKDWNFRTHNMDMLNLDENKSVYKKNYPWRKRFSEMGEMKRAQELRVDEVSMQKLRENPETIQKLTSQLQHMQEQMNSMKWFTRISSSEIESQREIVLRFQSACNDSKFSFLAEPRHMESIWITGTCFW